jgi:CHAT domain-containing protein
MYDESLLLIGPTATRTRVLHELNRRSVVHLATHATANLEFPDLSRFLFAPEGNAREMSALLARDLAGITFPRTKLVVLAACDTASGPRIHGEGVISLARPFLAGGVPHVAATLWPIDDRAARVLFTHLHRNIRNGMTTSEALRAAQLAILNDPTLPPNAWAAVTVLGS